MSLSFAVAIRRLEKYLLDRIIFCLTGGAARKQKPRPAVRYRNQCYALRAGKRHENRLKLCDCNVPGGGMTVITMALVEARGQERNAEAATAFGISGRFGEQFQQNATPGYGAEPVNGLSRR